MTNKPAEPPKSPRRKGIEAALLFLGMGELIRELFASPDDIHRQLQSEAIADTGVFEWKEWVVADDDACEFCQDMADHGLYSIDYEMLSHPNCRCTWVPVLPGEE
jgi:hypothetical protein